MFHEYAVEPTLLSSWDRTRFFLDALGPWKGRFLAKYPRHWKRMVHRALDCPDVEKKRIVERLAKLDTRVFSARKSADYRGECSWLENATSEHSREPFRAIIALHALRTPHVIDGTEVDDGHDLWRVETGQLVRRRPEVFAQKLRLLLVASTRLMLIDPYFRADQPDKTGPLIAFCRAAPSLVAVDVHFSDEPRGYSACMNDASRVLPGLLPQGVKVKLHCWNERPGGARLHNRFLLTEIGGVQFGDGIETGTAGQEDRVSILDETSRAALWDLYGGASPGFDAAGSAREFVGSPQARKR